MECPIHQFFPFNCGHLAWILFFPLPLCWLKGNISLTVVNRFQFVCEQIKSTISTEKLECLTGRQIWKYRKTRTFYAVSNFSSHHPHKQCLCKVKTIKITPSRWQKKIPWGQSYHSNFPHWHSPHFRRTGKLQLALGKSVTKHWLVLEKCWLI